jgi:cephalosporin hydroxylase
MDPIAAFNQERNLRIARAETDLAMQTLSAQWREESMQRMYVYNFSWLGRPIIQYPQDMVGLQEIVWDTKPDLIIETGIAHGGSLVFSASLLALLEMCESIETGAAFNPAKPKRKVLGVDIDIRSHNKDAILAHPLANRIEMIQGSSIASETIAAVKDIAKDFSNILVCLDSNHTHAHVLAELEAYAPLVGRGNYCVVFDTFVEDVPKALFADRPWGPGDNPKTAVQKYLSTHSEFQIDKSIENKLGITVAPSGYLRRIA